MSAECTPEWRRIHEKAVIVDLHAHPSLKVSLFKRALTSSFRASRAFDPLSVRTDCAKLKDGAVDVLLSCIYAPEQGIYQECPYLRLLRYLMPFTWRRVFSKSRYEVTLAMMDQMEVQAAKAVDAKTGKRLAKVVHSSQELDELLDGDGDHPVALIHAVEGAHSLDGNLDNLETLFDRGVAYITLAHFYPNEAVYPTFPFPESVQRFGCYKGVRNLALGLTQFGEALVERMVELGVILDIAHCTPPARERIYEIVGNRRPIIASHVGAYAINPSAYNLKDWEMRKIADSGGVVGIIFMNYWLMPHETKRGLNFIAQTINHCVNVAGIDHVGIGTDFDGFTDPPDDLKDASELCRLTQRLLAEGYHEDQIGKIWGGNALRVLREGWGRN
jgi:microsomal dipeptidase-like Zn-dependent dipeptidase